MSRIIDEKQCEISLKKEKLIVTSMYLNFLSGTRLIDIIKGKLLV